MAARALGDVGGFAVAFVAVVALLSPLRAIPDAEYLRPKLEHWRGHGERYDLVFIGSSRVQRGFDPEAFDARLAALERPLASFNFGVPGMFAHERDRLLREILAAKPRRLRWVLLEFQDYRDDSLRGEWGTNERMVWWHDAGATNAVVRSVLGSDRPLLERASLTYRHAKLACANLVHYGGAEALFAALRPAPTGGRHDVERMIARRGYASGDESARPAGGTAREFASPGARIMEEYASRVALRNRHDASLSHSDLGEFERVAALASDSGVRLFFVPMPADDATPLAYRLAEADLLPGLLPMNDPERFPTLWQTRYFQDADHMRASGAREFSARLAEAFAAEAKR